jgi:glucose-1-phosphate thymidylyltransferase
MKVIVPVAGEGTRLRPHTYANPKPLLPVVDKPILAHVLDPVVALSPGEVIFVIGYRGDMVRSYVRDNYDFKSTFIEQDRLLGLGYAVNMALERVNDDPVLILLGDTVVKCDLAKFANAGDFVLGLRKVKDPKRFGVAVVKDGKVVNLEEKPSQPKSNLAVIGLYYFSDGRKLKEPLAAHVKAGQMTHGEIQLTDALQALIAQGVPCTPYEVEAWYDCGKLETVLHTNRDLLDQRGETPAFDGSEIHPPVFVADSATVVNSELGPHVSVSEGAVVKDSKLRNSIIGPYAVVENCELADSMIGGRATVRGARGNVNIGDASSVELWSN